MAPRRSASPTAASLPSRARRAKPGKAATRAPQVVRWPGHIKPGTVKNQLFAALDWLPTLVDIAGGAKGDALKNQIEAGQYPGIVKTTLDGFDQREYLEGTSARSALAKRQKTAETGVGRTVRRINKNGRAVSEIEAAAYDQSYAGCLCGLMGADDASQRVAVDDRQGFEAKFGGTCEELVARTGAPQEREMRGALQLGIARGRHAKIP